MTEDQRRGALEVRAASGQVEALIQPVAGGLGGDVLGEPVPGGEDGGDHPLRHRDVVNAGGVAEGDVGWDAPGNGVDPGGEGLEDAQAVEARDGLDRPAPAEVGDEDVGVTEAGRGSPVMGTSWTAAPPGSSARRSLPVSPGIHRSMAT